FEMFTKKKNITALLFLTGGLVDAGLEDAGLSGHGVPESVDADEEEQCGDVLLLGEHLEDAAVGADRARIRLLLTPAPRFAQSATDPPGDEGDDEQMGEDDPRAQQSHGLEQGGQQEADH